VPEHIASDVVSSSHFLSCLNMSLRFTFVVSDWFLLVMTVGLSYQKVKYNF
jgi:hypothetical protein